MLTTKSKEMMVRSIRKTQYEFREAPAASFKRDYGIYIHIPFCMSRCSFCPFYKELYDSQLKDRYVHALCTEIETASLSGKPAWVYFGGGTPNTLSIEDVSRIMASLKQRVSLSNVGMELLPARITFDYLYALKDLGFTKISMGVESLQADVLESSGRRNQMDIAIGSQLEQAHDLGLKANVDLMIGLTQQTSASFLDDVRMLATYHPYQVTLYPFMIIGNQQVKPAMDDHQQFGLIEQAASLLQAAGYNRKGVWIFSKGEDVYDSSRDELVTDYAGFGAAAFSTYDTWKVVNPELSVYLYNSDQNKHLAFVAPKSADTDAWRRFARMIYDLKLHSLKDVPMPIHIFVKALQLLGYGSKGRLTNKGVLFAHTITKTVVQMLPYPLQNPPFVSNWESYEQLRSTVTEKTPIQV